MLLQNLNKEFGRSDNRITLGQQEAVLFINSQQLRPLTASAYDKARWWFHELNAVIWKALCEEDDEFRKELAWFTEQFGLSTRANLLWYAMYRHQSPAEGEFLDENEDENLGLFIKLFIRMISIQSKDPNEAYFTLYMDIDRLAFGMDKHIDFELVQDQPGVNYIWPTGNPLPSDTI